MEQIKLINNTKRQHGHCGQNWKNLKNLKFGIKYVQAMKKRMRYDHF